MDFGSLLHAAQQNENNKKSDRPMCYQTKFAPPKKETSKTKTLSENIKKFLAKKEEEERQKLLLEKKKRENLLALRDHKAQSKINKHLKVCKAANKAAIADAIDYENTAITIAGPSQPDEDDYGYTSKEATAFYDSLMNKYSNMPAEKPLFSESSKKTVKDIASTKDRVKQALKQQEQDELSGVRKKRKTKESGESSSKSSKDIISEKEREPDPESEVKPKPKKKPSMAPPMDFMALLKLAEKKQHEPIVVEVKPKVVEPERLMTKKQMKEFQKEKEWKESKDKRKSGKVEETPKQPEVPEKPSKAQKIPKPVPEKVVPKVNPTLKKNVGSTSHEQKVRISEKERILEERRKLEADRKALEEMRRGIEEEKRKLEMIKMKAEESKKVNGKPYQKQVAVDSRKEVMKSERPRMKPALMKNEKKFAPSRKRNRIESDDEYDSDLADFIDDGPDDEGENYSMEISKLFGYDRNKYSHLDDEDDAAMESNFHQQMKEEIHSTKMGIMEDLEDIRRENEMKKRAKANKKPRK